MSLSAVHLEGALAALVVPASRLAHEPRRPRLSTGLAALDDALGGGWPAAALSELSGPRSAGRTSVLHAALTAAMGGGHTVALIDAAGVFDPRTAEAAGVILSRLLWIRAAGRTLLQAAELLVATGGFGLVAVDLGERPSRVPDASWVRLRHAAERQGTTVLVTAPRRIAGATAAAAVVLRAPRPRFADAGAPLLEALETRASIERLVGAVQPPANESALCFSAVPPVPL